MTNKRHNIETIAEVLIDRLNAMEKTAMRIEIAAAKELKVDTTDLDRKIKHLTVLTDDYIRKIEQNKTRRLSLPKWLVIGFICLCILFSGSVTLNIYQKFEYDKVHEAAVVWYKKAHNENDN
ncbi:hypothetical protein [Prolixibacter sp. SD074]|uniref:hypothetical protein n=1 Tax=Prolixibacter sp. SD074 TaxID=2652391 RepID=UPI00127F177A|nr:hypothetical protein [Prolixibacter sp. SD074]GET29421.1 hypothetical protein SD074_16230 [Prolixibacter sp. SD074]